ncbi:MAG: PBP1A family penicillin-binding protein [Acidobacteriia bacterium]|nr:PBP1A family penicillin-binding protein [Terriglobia bacterium]
MKPIYDQLPPVEVAGTRLVGRVVFALLVVASALIGAFGGLLLVYSTDLPEVDELQRYHPSTITELYDDQGRVIGSFALQRRILVSYEDFPKVLRDAIISVEDKDFEKHWGVNFWRILGAAYKDIALGQKAQGGSTLTMQLSRNLFLTPERSFHRKIQEIMLAIQIERRFTKPQIFALYANQIFLGHGAYGFEAGSQLYFSKHAKDLTLDEAALLAGLPKAPNYYSPLNNPERSARRRNLVLNAMLEDGKITAEQAARAKSMPILLRIQSDPNSLAPYFVEEVRRYLEKKYGADEVHQGGLRVYTTLNKEMQEAANKAVLDGLAAYERRHGWKGNLPNMVAAGLDIDKYQHADWDEPLAPGSYVHALVTGVKGSYATVKFGRYTAPIAPADMAWTAHKSPEEILSRGDIVYVKVLSLAGTGNSKVSLEQDSGTQGALLAIDNASGDIKAMVGGRDYDESKFNRATQAMRQVGSSFKPYVYTAAIDDGATPDDIILDAPVTFMTASGAYSPHNYDGKFEGNITLRRAIAQSRNIPALKTAAKVGIHKVIEYTRKFGITSPLPPVLPLALGAADLTLMEQVSGFTTFPNDGVRVVPRYIRKVADYDGRIMEENFPDVKDVISPRTARIMTSLLREVVLHGTAFQASKLNHPLAGKTGTTNDFTDAWFVGFSPSIACGVWVGYDEKKTLGKKETGALAALPIWIDFMKVALKGRDQEDFALPPGIPRNAAAKVDTPDFRPGDGESH